jgi:AAA family ATP:ADP antiporter
VRQLGALRALSGKFLPMLALFFCLAFVNTVLDSLKDTLVITAAGGGADVIPFLTVYAVLPSSVLFLVAFAAASQRMSRRSLFNAIICSFAAFFAVFGIFLYPNAQALHPHAAAETLAAALPSGLSGLVGMFRNWTFTLFFCVAEARCSGSLPAGRLLTRRCAPWLLPSLHTAAALGIEPPLPTPPSADPAKP